MFLIHRLSFRIWKGIFNIYHTFDEPANFTPFWNDWTRSNFIVEEAGWWYCQQSGGTCWLNEIDVFTKSASMFKWWIQGSEVLLILLVCLVVSFFPLGPAYAVVLLAHTLVSLKAGTGNPFVWCSRRGMSPGSHHQVISHLAQTSWIYHDIYLVPLTSHDIFMEQLQSATVVLSINSSQLMQS